MVGCPTHPTNNMKAYIFASVLYAVIALIFIGMASRAIELPYHRTGEISISVILTMLTFSLVAGYSSWRFIKAGIDNYPS